MIVYARLEEVLALLLRGCLVPVAPAEPRDTARLSDGPLQLVREVGIEACTSTALTPPQLTGVR